MAGLLGRPYMCSTVALVPQPPNRRDMKEAPARKAFAGASFFLSRARHRRCLWTVRKLLADVEGGMITTMARDRSQHATPDLFLTASNSTANRARFYQRGGSRYRPATICPTRGPAQCRQTPHRSRTRLAHCGVNRRGEATGQIAAERAGKCTGCADPETVVIKGQTAS